MAFLSSFDGTRIFYDYHKGKKETLIFIHGWPLNHTVWDKEVKYCRKKNYGTIIVDLRGHGKSDKPSDINAYHINNFARDISEIIKRINIKKPVLVGHSFGGMIVLKFVEIFPKKVKAIILIDTSFESPLKDILLFKFFKLTPITNYLLQFIGKHKSLQKKYFKEVEFSRLKKHSDFFYWLKGARQTALGSIIACLKEMLEFDESKILNKIRIPTLILEGEKDKKIPKKVAIKMYKKIKGSKLVVIKKGTHDTNIKNSGQINRAITTFLLDLKKK